MQPLTWTALEYEHKTRSSDWFWSLGVVALGGAILAIVLGNILFALFIILGAVTLSLYAMRRPHDVVYEINDRGVVINNALFPYQTLESFDIHDHLHTPRLMVKSQKVVMPYLVIPIEGVHPEDVREMLAERIPEVDIPESFSEKLMAVFGL